jgi:hypothetical protein
MGWFERLFNQMVNQMANLSRITDPVSSAPLSTRSRAPALFPGWGDLACFRCLSDGFPVRSTAAVFPIAGVCRFTVTFWILFGTSYIFLPILASISEGFRRFVMWFLSEGEGYTLLNIGWHLLVTAAC